MSAWVVRGYPEGTLCGLSHSMGASVNKSCKTTEEIRDGWIQGIPDTIDDNVPLDLIKRKLNPFILGGALLLENQPF